MTEKKILLQWHRVEHQLDKLLNSDFGELSEKNDELLSRIKTQTRNQKRSSVSAVEHATKMAKYSPLMQACIRIWERIASVISPPLELNN